MNRNAVLFHLREAAEELNKMLSEIEQRRSYSEASLEVAMGHLYHHLNTAWNGRAQTAAQFKECSDDDFDRFRRFPKEHEFAYLEPLDCRTKHSSARRVRASVPRRTSAARRR
jgi:hypothetical protein